MIDLASALHANEAIVPHVYQAVVDPGHWDEAVRRITDFLDSPFGMISISYPRTRSGEIVASAGFPEWALRAWEDRHADNEWVQLAATVEPGQVLHAGTSITVEQILETGMGRELIGPQGIRDAMGVKMTDSPLVVGALSAYAMEEYEPACVDRLAFLAPHLARGLALHRCVQADRWRSATMRRSLDELSAGLVLLRCDRFVMHLNRAAERMVGEDDGLALRDGRLVISDVEARSALDDAIRGLATGSSTPAGRAGLFRVARHSGERPYHVVVSPSVRPVLDPGREDAVLLWITDPAATVVPSPEALASLLDLTPAEARVAAGIASGLQVREYAEQAGVTEGTARWTLKRVLAKTNTSTQAQLVKLVLQSLPSPPF